MENLDTVTSKNFAPLFIQEVDDGTCEVTGEHSLQRSPAQSENTFTCDILDQTASIAQYLKEMDDLLKSSEETSNITKITCSQEYMSTSSTDTQENVLDEPQCMSFAFANCPELANVSSSMSLTSAGNKLSKSMVEYEGELLDILGMLESCVDDSNMDSKPQGYTSRDSNEEYVHIPKLFKETAKTTVEPSKETILEAHAAAMALCDNQDNTAGKVYVRKRASRALTQSAFNCDNSRSLTVQSPEKISDVNNTAVQDKQPQGEWTKSEPNRCEKTSTEEEHKGDFANIADLLNEVEVDITGLKFGVSDFQILGPKLDKCIEEVQCLVQKRKELLAEVTKLHGYSQQEQTAEINENEEQMDQTDSKVAELISRLTKEENLRREKSQSEIEKLRQERAKAERELWRLSVERQGLHNELWRFKRQLFVIARECAQIQAALSGQQRNVELLKKQEEELQIAETHLREDSNKLQQEHGLQLVNLQEQLNIATSSLLKNTQEQTQSRRDSCGDVQHYLQDSLKALEERYEPILIALLKRRDTAVDACVKVKEQVQEMRVQLTPLREEIQKLALQKVCLEEKFKLSSFQRKEKIGQYKETVDSLEESCRELKMELRIQKAKTNEMKELKEILNKKLTTYRSAIENHMSCDYGCDEEAI